MIQTMIGWQGCNIKGNQLPYAGLFPDLNIVNIELHCNLEKKRKRPLRRKGQTTEPGCGACSKAPYLATLA